MKLTVGMIVKNEEKWLDKCLSAIKPILDNVDSELIITDTGSTDRTVEIAKKYTDKVLHFDWVNDFSAARNFGLEKASGEWFMMLDADDIFRSCDNIISFFNSGEYKNYNAGSYLSRNILKTENGTCYNDIWVPRMVRIRPETKYIGNVHEHLSTFAPPFRNINDIADHYGYFYENEEQKLNKANRNAALLLKKYEADRISDPMLYVQLYETYMILDEEKALGYLDEGISVAAAHNNITLVSLYFHKVSYYYSAGDYSKALDFTDEYFKVVDRLGHEERCTDAEIYALRAESFFRSGRYAEAIEPFKKFFEVFRNIKSGRTATYDAYLVAGFMCSDINNIPLLNDLLTCCIRCGKLNTADMYLSTYPIYEYESEPIKVRELVSNIITVSESFSHSRLDVYYTRLGNMGKKLLADELIFMLGDTEKRDDIFTALGKIGKKDAYVLKKANIYRLYYEKKDFDGDIAEFIKEFGIDSDIDLIYLIILKKYDISMIFDADGMDIKKSAYLCCKNIDGFYPAIEDYSPECVTRTDKIPEISKFFDCCISMKLIANENVSEEEKKQLVGKLVGIKQGINAKSGSERRNSEFDELSAVIKNNIRSLIAAGKIDEAIKTIEEYRIVNPDDDDIPVLLNECKG